MKPDLRRTIEKFCLERAQRIVQALSPERIVIIGLGTFDRLVAGQIALSNNGRTLAKSGKLWGRPALGVIHLSGSRVSRADLGQLSHFVDLPNSN